MTNFNLVFIININALLFIIGLLGIILNRKNILITIMSLEIMLLAINLNFIIFSVYLNDIIGYLFILFLLTIAAIESSIGLSLLITYYLLKNTITMEKINNYKI